MAATCDRLWEFSERHSMHVLDKALVANTHRLALIGSVHELPKQLDAPVDQGRLDVHHRLTGLLHSQPPAPFTGHDAEPGADGADVDGSRRGFVATAGTPGIHSPPRPHGCRPDLDRAGFSGRLAAGGRRRTRTR